ncbi:MAG TPA: hypothetical protein VJX23_06140 [Candidatus Binataceae bacterium]|nr:hypothetical protein [Candidatus Binataceae bacterium]
MGKRTLRVAGFAIAVFALAGISSAAHAFMGGGVGGGIGGAGFSGGGIGGGGMHAGGFSGGPISGSNISPGISAGMPIGAGAMAPQRFRNLDVVGQVGVVQSKLPANAAVVRLRLDGRDIPMRLNTEEQSAELQFDPNASYAQDLYRSILTKRIEVVGEQSLRDEITEAAAQSKPIEVEGYVFHRSSPYLVVKSVKPL